MHPRQLLVLCVTAACTDARSPSATAGECVPAITTGVAGRSTQQSDTDHGINPNRDVPIVVVRADDPALAQPIPPDLAVVADHVRADLDVGPPGRKHRRRIALPPERLGAPIASTTTDAQGCFAVELPPGTYALGKAQSMTWIDFDVVQGRATSCNERTGYRFAIWDCAD